MSSPDNVSKPPLSTPPPSRKEIEEAKTDPPPSPEAAPSAGSEVDDLREDTRVKFHVDRLDREVPGTEETAEESEIRETVIPSKKAVLEIAVKYALDQNLDLDGMKVDRLIFDEGRNMLLADVSSPTADGGSLLITYTIQGRHGKNQAKVTSIEWVSCDSDGMPDNGGNVADYKDGTWVKRY